LMAAWRQYESLVIAARQQSREALGQMHCVEGRQAGAQGQASTSAAALMKVRRPAALAPADCPLGCALYALCLLLSHPKFCA
jgi:hypothetical protein